jgi:nucleotide-binding universal stress UspA family protein
MVKENNIDLVIAATHGGSGFRRFLIGSVTDRLVKIIECPLLVLQPGEHQKDFSGFDNLKFKRILVGCDFSPDSKQAFDYALSLAQEFEAQLHLVHVIRLMEKEPFWGADDPQSASDGISAWTLHGDLNPRIKPAGTDSGKKSKVMEEIEKQLLGLVPEDCQNWCTPVTVILEGQPYRELIEYADKKQVDLMVLGIHGHNFLERVIVGSTTDRVISRSSCPVLAVRTQEKTAQ